MPPENGRYRLAFAIHRYFPFGGLQRDLRRLAAACARQQHEVHVLTGEWHGPAVSELNVHVLPLKSRTNHGRSREFSKVIQEFVRREPFDCVIGFNRMSGLDLYFCGDPCLAEYLRQSHLPLVRWLPRYRAYLGLEAEVFGPKHDTELLVLCESEKERIVRHYATPENRLHLLPPGIDAARLEAKANGAQQEVTLRRELGIRQEDFLMLMVGSNFNTKGVDRALAALGSLPREERSRAFLVVVGEGNPRPYRRLAARWGVGSRVVFAGARDDVARFYRAADVLLHPARLETTGLVLLEAMYCGLPVLVTENCGYASHIRRADGGLVCAVPFKQREFNRLVARTFSNEKRQQWRNNALRYCAVNDISSMVERAVKAIVSRAERKRNAA